MTASGRKIAVIAGLCFLLLAAMLLSIFFGSTSIDVFAILCGGQADDLDKAILLRERLPRTIIGASVGASLAAAGLAFQAILKNPLADPYVIGVAGGSAIGGTLAMILPVAAIFGQAGVSVMAFIFGMLAIAGTYRLSRDSGGRVNVWEVLLVGVIFNTFASAIIMFMKSVVRAQKAQEMLMWLMGTLSSDIRGPGAIMLSVGMTVAGSAVLFWQAPALNALGQSTYEGLHYLASLRHDHGDLWRGSSTRDGLPVRYSSGRTLLGGDGNARLSVYLARADGMQFCDFQLL